jgi:protein SCO1/2
MRFLTACLPFLCALPASPQDISFEQRLNQPVPLDLSFRDEAGRPASLRDLAGGRASILALVYYRCPQVCTMVMNGLLTSLRSIPLEAGKDFTVLVVSIDPSEAPPLAAERKASVLKRYDRPGAAEGWRFLTGEEPAIRGVAEAVGFRYARDPNTGLYAHPAGLVVLTPDGRAARYFFGAEYPARDLRLALVESSGGKIGSATDALLLLCSRYDPATGRYSLAVLSIVRSAGLATLLALGFYVGRAVRRERRRRGARGT